MLAYDNDAFATPPFVAEAERLVELVTRAGRSLALSAPVPDEVVALVSGFERSLHAGSPLAGLAGVEPGHAEVLLGGAVICLTALTVNDTVLRRRRLRVGLEQMRQALRTIVEGAPVRDDRPASEVARWLVGVLDVPQPGVADLVGVSHRTLQRWISTSDPTAPAGDDAARLRTVAAAVSHLRHALTGPGVVHWFHRPLEQLDGSAPADLLGDPAQFPRLRGIAAAARSAVAS